MGMVTCLMIYNDSLHELTEDPELGQKLRQAVSSAGGYEQPKINTRGGTGAVVVTCHHNSETSIVAIGGHQASVLGFVGNGVAGESRDVEILRKLAAQMGFTLTKKRK